MNDGRDLDFDTGIGAMVLMMSSTYYHYLLINKMNRLEMLLCVAYLANASSTTVYLSPMQ